MNLNWEDYVEFAERYLRPTEVDLLIGDPSKARQKLAWEPSVTFEQLVTLMVDADLQALGIVPVGYKVQSIEDFATVRAKVPSFAF